MIRVLSLCVIVSSAAVFAAPYTELVPKFNRLKSVVMVRSIESPTRANLDYAAYSNNPVRFDPKSYKPSRTGAKVELADLTFGGMLENACNTLDETPLTDDEKSRPMAWKPVENQIWGLTKDPGWMAVSTSIEGEKWGDAAVFKPFQEIGAVYLHGEGSDAEMWVKIEFMPWVKFLGAITDDDADGLREIFGRLTLKGIGEESVGAAVEWIRGDYTARLLNREEIVDWINVLASYWYPTLNTDVVDLGGETSWPTADTDKKIKKALKGLTVNDPAAVVRGNPFGKPIYNVYVVEGLEKSVTATAGRTAAVVDKTADMTISENFKENEARFKKELKAHGGSYEEWARKNKPYMDAARKFLDALPPEQMGFKGKGDWIFFRKSLEYMTAGDLNAQPFEKNPLPHLVAFKEFCTKNNINLLFVPVPNKEDVYYENLPVTMPGDGRQIIYPYGRKFLSQLQEAGIEVIDLLPHFLKAKAEDDKHDENVYQLHDTHFTNRGLQIMAALIAERIRHYSWYNDLAADKVAYTIHDTTFSRQGDIVDKLPDSERAAYPAVTLKARQVRTPDGKNYRLDRNGPILLMGDSFTGVFELVDCKSAGLGSHIAAKTGVPVDVVTSWGGGPLVRQRMYRVRKDDLAGKRVIVYVMVARDLYNYAQSWEPFKPE